MSEKQGKESSSITLPKGGGAVKGIGETFQPNLFSGTGNFSVPIYTSPGRNNFGPKLNLQYSSGNGNGIFGMGWQLSIPRITRKTEKGIPQYTDQDVFVMSGAEDLVPVDEENLPSEGDYNRIRYQPRTEGLFARIEKWTHLHNEADTHWRVTTKENITSIYGKTNHARIIHLEDATKIYEWLLQETFDAKGNHILYEYIKGSQNQEREEVYGKDRIYTQAYIHRILYGNTPEGLLNENATRPERLGSHHSHFNQTQLRQYMFEVLFDYGDLPETPAIPYSAELFSGNNADDWNVRKDAFSSFRAGFEIRTALRCQRVLMLHHFDEDEIRDAPLIKTTCFEYDTSNEAECSHLVGVELKSYRREYRQGLNYDQYFSRSLPKLEFRYSQFVSLEQHYQSVEATAGDLPPRSLNTPDFILFDIHGNALPDILNTTDSAYYFWENLGDGVVDRRHPQHRTPAGVTLTDPRVAVGDMGGDGLPDLVVEAQPLSGFYEASPNGDWKPFKKFQETPTFSLSDPNVRLLDLTGDGLSDVLITRDKHFLWYRCLGEAGYELGGIVPRRRNLEEFPDIYFSDQSGRVRLADMTGDGLNDIVLVHDGRIDYWPNLGYGRFGPRFTVKNAPRYGYGFDPKRLFLVDLNGTGCSDAVYVDFDRVHFWFNCMGNSFGVKKTINGTPYTVDSTAVQFADFLGTGTATLVWSYDYNLQQGSNYKILDFCGGKKPHLLEEMNNNLGAITRVQYAPSTKFYLEDKRNGVPWISTLPFPVQVVERTEVIDAISGTKLVTSYKYHHGYYDGREREFRGFGRVDQYDTESFESFSDTTKHNVGSHVKNASHAYHVPPVLTKNWFHTGIYFDENSGSENSSVFDFQDMLSAYKKEYYQGDALAFELENNRFTDKNGNEISVRNDAPHEAYRALRGALLRTEIYAQDDTEKSAHPYAVTENRYQVKRLQTALWKDSKIAQHGIYFSSQAESLSYHYERLANDPRIAHDINLQVDPFGNITDKVSIAYPRREVADRLDKPEQTELKTVYSRQEYINVDKQSDYYYIGLPCQSRVYEITGIEWRWGQAHLDKTRFERINDFDSNSPLAAPASFRAYEWQRPTEHEGIEKRLVEWSRQYFRRDADPELLDAVDAIDHRLTLGEIESLALGYESYQAAFNNNLLQSIFEGREDTNILTSEGGYTFEEDFWWIPSGRQSYNQDLFYLTERTQDPFGNMATLVFDDYALLAIESQDAIGNKILSKNNYRTLQAYQIRDPNNNFSEVAFDALGLVVGTAAWGQDASGNRVGDSFTHFVADLDQNEINEQLNNPSDNPLDLLQQASIRLIYDLYRFIDHQQPAVVCNIAREIHSSNPDGENSPAQLSFLYSDGLGREIQTKILGDPQRDQKGNVIGRERWLSDGLKIYNNKGKPVREYEPFFSDDHNYGVEQHGVSRVVFYDPLERAICTLHPDNTYEKVVFDTWRQMSWDKNDTLLSHPSDDRDIRAFIQDYLHDLEQKNEMPYQTWHNIQTNSGEASRIKAARDSESHANTPSIVFLDTMGRTFLTHEDNGNDVTFATEVTLDIEGNELSITDPREITAFTHYFDLSGRKLRIDSVDAGSKRLLLSVDEQPIQSWDANGNVVSQSYDRLRRGTYTRVQRPAPFNDEIISQVTVYGEHLEDDSELDLAAINNHRGKPYLVFDGAGLVVNGKFDFKGNLVETRRILTRDYQDLPNWKMVDLNLSPEQILQSVQESLEQEVFVSSNTYDALNRITTSNAPDHTLREDINDNSPEDGSVYFYTYNPLNQLRQIRTRTNGVDSRYLKNINYNARGQRESIRYGNNVTTEYTYDNQTFRLQRLKSTRRDNSRVQDLKYTYDPVGNITEIRDDTIQTIWHDQQQIDPVCQYTYDPTYHLITASGREHKAISANHYRNSNVFKQSEYLKLPPTTDAQALQMYCQEYSYDPSGNLIEVIHHRGRTTSGRILWRRRQDYADSSNRIYSSGADDQGISIDPPAIYPHDANGNFLKLPQLKNGGQYATQNLHWDYQNQLVKAELNADANTSYYTYDATGQRARKIIVKGDTRQERIYLGGYEVYREYNAVNNITLERKTLHIMDDQQRIALFEFQSIGTEQGVPEALSRYQLNNHLQSSAKELEGYDSAKIISNEEYYPYGGTAFTGGRNAKADEKIASSKRYRYSGKERDDETGLYYYGARYYAPWLGRWCSADPMGLASGTNTYQFVKGNSINKIDLIGLEDEPAEIITSENKKVHIPNHVDLSKKPSSEELGRALIDSFEAEYPGKSIEVDLNSDKWSYKDGNWHYDGYVSDPFEIETFESANKSGIESVKSEKDTAAKINPANNGEGMSGESDLNKKLDSVQTTLALVGIVPILGEPADMINGIISFSRGEYTDGFMSLASVIPFMGVAIGASRVLKKSQQIEGVYHTIMKHKRTGDILEYVGQSKGVWNRFKQHFNHARGKLKGYDEILRKVIPMPNSSKFEREIAEQALILWSGGINGNGIRKLLNSVNPVGGAFDLNSKAGRDFFWKVFHDLKKSNGWSF